MKIFILLNTASFWLSDGRFVRFEYVTGTISAEWLIEMMKKKLNLGDGEEEKPEQKLETLTLEGVAKYIADGKCKRIVTMAGAGISTCK